MTQLLLPQIQTLQMYFLKKEKEKKKKTLQMYLWSNHTDLQVHRLWCKQLNVASQYQFECLHLAWHLNFHCITNLHVP